MQSALRSNRSIRSLQNDRSPVCGPLYRFALLAVSLIACASHHPLTAQDAKVASPDDKKYDAQQYEAKQQALRDFETTVREAVRKVQPATVGVAGGSGVIISSDGYLLTVAHVASQAGKHLPVTLPDGRRVRAVVVGTHQSFDAAVCKIIDSGTWPTVSLGNSQSLQQGDWVIAMGYPMSFDKTLPPAVRVGRITRRSEREITADCPIMGGDSGGPLIDINGHVIGIGTRCDDDRTAVNFFVSEQVYRDHWQRMLLGENIVTSRPRNGGIKRPQRPDWAEGFEPIAKHVSHYPGTRMADLAKTTGQVATSNEPITVRRIPTLMQQDVPAVGRRKAIEQVLGHWPDTKQHYLEVYADKRRIAAGTLWGSQGVIVTKASLLEPWAKDSLFAVTPSGSRLPLAWIGASHVDDLAVLHLGTLTNASSDPSMPRSFGNQIDLGSVDLGSIVLSESDENGTSLGFVVSRPRRFSIRQPELEKPRALLGIRTRAEAQGLFVVDVYPDSAAAAAGLCVGDVLTKADGRDLKEPKDLTSYVQSSSPGTKLELSLLRDHEPLSLAPVLRLSTPEAPQTSFDNWGGGPFSLRRFGFGEVLVHDTAIYPEDCGGPVVDINGKVIGVNISRATRISTFAIPAERVDQVVKDLLAKSPVKVRSAGTENRSNLTQNSKFC